MSWVLILSRDTQPPAIIGGYGTRDDAEKAGREATAYGRTIWSPSPFYNSFTVFPGTALHAPQMGSVHCHTNRFYDSGSKVLRTTTRWPEGETEREITSLTDDPL